MAKYPDRKEYPEYKTLRQWAKEGKLLRPDATGIDLYANCIGHEVFRYYSPAEVRSGEKAELDAYFEPERKRRNALRIKRENERINAEKKKKQEIQDRLDSYSERIWQLSLLNAYTDLAEYSKTERTNTFVIDTETTGLDPVYDELLQLSIIDLYGNKVYDSFFNPCVREWPAAQAVNHISPEMVKDSPRLDKAAREIRTILSSAATIIGYNTTFDINMLRANGLLQHDVEEVDVMRLFAPVYGEYNEYHESYTWKSLSVAAEYFDYDWPEESKHNSLNDCLATLHVYKHLQQMGVC